MFYFFFQAEDGIRDYKVTGVQTCALPIYLGDLLALAHGLVFLDQQRLVVRVGREVGVVVLEDDQVAIATQAGAGIDHAAIGSGHHGIAGLACDVVTDRKSTRLNSSHLVISYAVFCLKKKDSLSPGCR